MKTYLLSLLCFLVLSLQAQIKTGTLEMGITDFEMNMPGDMPEGFDMGEMMKSMKYVMHFKPGLLVQEMSMMGMMNMKIFIEGDTVSQYMDAMGQKWLIKTAANPMEQFGLNPEELKNMYKVAYNKSVRKEFQGYDCHEAMITMDMKSLMEKMNPDQELPEEFESMFDKMEMTAYVTDVIEMPMPYLQQFQGLQIEGAPLYMKMDMGMMSMTMEATSISRDVSLNIFERPAAGEYKEMSLEELQSMGMDAGGFGF